MSLSDAPPTPSDIASEFKDVFSGEGKLEEKLHLEFYRSVPPKALLVRKVSLAVKKPLKQELERLVKTSISEPVDVPTDWISLMVVVKKKKAMEK